MPRVTINNVGAIGLIKDHEGYHLPPEAWSDARNIRFLEGMAVRFLGHNAALDPPTVAPHFLFPTTDGTNLFWVYAGLNAVYCVTGGVHTDITRLLGAYSATADRNWNGGILAGVPILNNGVDAPQMWPSIAAGTDLITLDWVTGVSTWESLGYTADIIRPFGQFLVALGVDTGTYNSRLVQWSHPAAPRTIPDSWDPADATKDTGYWELAETGEALVDCLPLGKTNVIYKGNSCYGMSYVGGQNIFRFDKLFGELGLLAPRCAIEFNKQHYIFAQGDIVKHDGNGAQSLVNEKIRNYIFNGIDSANYLKCFVAPNFFKDEIWFCFPEAGSTYCNIAAVHNFRRNTMTLRELPNVSAVGYGNFDPTQTSGSWGADSGAWGDDITAWNTLNFNPSVNKMLMASPADTKIYEADTTNLFNGATFTSYLERVGLAIVGQDRQGAPIVDTNSIKHITRIVPRMEISSGGTVDFYVGGQMTPEDPVTYSGPYTFDPSVSMYVDCITSIPKRYLAIKLVSDGEESWDMHGYDLDLNIVGKF